MVALRAGHGKHAGKRRVRLNGHKAERGEE